MMRILLVKLIFSHYTSQNLTEQYTKELENFKKNLLSKLRKRKIELNWSRELFLNNRIIDNQPSDRQVVGVHELSDFFKIS